MCSTSRPKMCSFKHCLEKTSHRIRCRDFPPVFDITIYADFFHTLFLQDSKLVLQSPRRPQSSQLDSSASIVCCFTCLGGLRTRATKRATIGMTKAESLLSPHYLSIVRSQFFPGGYGKGPEKGVLLSSTTYIPDERPCLMPQAKENPEKETRRE